MFASLLMFWTFDADAIEYFEFFEEEKGVETVRLFFGDRISWQVKDDELVERGKTLYLIGVWDLVVSDVQLHETSELWELS